MYDKIQITRWRDRDKEEGGKQGSREGIEREGRGQGESNTEIHGGERWEEGKEGGKEEKETRKLWNGM